MKTTGADQTYIDYETGKKSNFGIRVWAGHCSAITNWELSEKLHLYLLGRTDGATTVLLRSVDCVPSRGPENAGEGPRYESDRAYTGSVDR
jgi:hypothetical protein